MSETELNDLLSQLEALSAEYDPVPFPYRGTRAAYDEYGDVLYDINGNLNTYTMGISSFGSRGKRLFQWEEKYVVRFLEFYPKTFFERFPQYAVLQEPLANGQYPDLNFYLENTDKQRKILLVLFQEVEDRRRSSGRQ